MIVNNLKYPFIFTLLIAIQVLVLNNINLGGYVNPYIYLLFILWLPVEMKDWVVMFLALITGLVMDTFMSTPGIHASACVFLAFARKYVLYYMKPRDGYETNIIPDLKNMGASWFLTYSIILISLHHIFYFFVEIFRFSDLLYVFWRAIASIFMSTLIIIVIELLFSGNNETRR